MRSHVPLPVMPKGVEHKALLVAGLMAAAVPLPVMPKGVEHLAAQARMLESMGCPSQ